MFDIAFSELLVIAVVALLVIGPERLPKVARTLGLLAGRMQRYVSSVKADLEREMQIDDLSQLRDDARRSLSSMDAKLRDEAGRLEQDVKQAAEDSEPKA